MESKGKPVESKGKTQQPKLWELTVREVRVWKAHVPAGTAKSAEAFLRAQHIDRVFPYEGIQLEIEDIKQLKG